MVKGIIGVVVALIFGLGLTGVGAKILLDGNANRNWPAAQGTVSAATVETRTDTNTKRRGKNGRRRTTTTDTDYVATVRYTYTVNGRPYTGSRYSAASSSLSTSETRGGAESALRRYPVGSPVTVYYNPRNPAQAVLQRGTGGVTGWLFTVLGLIPLGIGGVLAWRTFGGRG